MKLVSLLSLLFFQYVQAQTTFNTFLNQEMLKPAQVSLLVYNNDKKQLLGQFQEEKLFYPASLQKLFTTSAALYILEKDFIFDTKVNFKGELSNGNFKGILEIVASGDPSLNHNFIDFVLKIFKENNINSFEGYISVNEANFDRHFEQSWLLEDIANYYGSPAFGFNFLDNTYRITFEQSIENETPTIKHVSPPMHHLRFENMVISKGTKDKAYILGVPFSEERKIVGSIPPGDGIFTIKGAIDCPAQVFKNLMLEKFKEEGLNFLFNANVEAEKIILNQSFKSESLLKIISKTNQKSNNLYAEALLKTIGLKQFGFGSIENGLKAISSLYDINWAKIYDGSGLSRKNALTANNIMSLLKANATNKSFQSSLAVSGKSGTLKYFTSEKLANNLRGKSGSADGVLNYAGYFENAKKEQILFVFCVSNFNGNSSNIRKEMIKVLSTFW